MRRSLGWKIALTAFVLHAFYAAGYLGTPQALSTLDLTVSLVDRGRLDIDPYAGNSRDVAKFGEHYYSGMPPGASIAAVPIYVAIKPLIALVSTPERERRLDDRYVRSRSSSWAPSEKRLTLLILTFAATVLGFAPLAGLTAVLFHRALGILYPDLDGRSRLVTTWLASFGTLYFYYASTFAPRVLSTFLCFWAFVRLLEAPGRRGRVAAALVGLALGGAVASAYDAAIGAACVGAFALSRRDWRPLWPYALAGSLACAGLLAAYHARCFGGPLQTSYSRRISPEISPGLYNRSLAQTTSFATESAHRVFWRATKLLAGQRYGVFFYSPLLLLSLPALARLRPRDPLAGPAAVAFSMLALTVTFHFFTGYSGAPGEFGFHYAIGPLPFLMLLLPASYRWSYRFVLPALAAASAFVLAKGVMYGASRTVTFLGDYPALFARYGIANYTLANLKDHLMPGLSPAVITAVHLAALAATLAALRYLVWRPGGAVDRRETAGVAPGLECARSGN